MIVIGYQGIGKSTCAKNYNRYIDLESSCFWHNGKRPEEWFVYYCQVAEHLDDQGYEVFTSSHLPVRNWFKNSKHKAICVVPALKLRDEWIKKLRTRYEHTKSDKDRKAYLNAVDRFDENISEIMNCGIPCVTLHSMEYDLDYVVRKYLVYGKT